MQRGSGVTRGGESSKVRVQSKESKSAAEKRTVIKLDGKKSTTGSSDNDGSDDESSSSPPLDAAAQFAELIEQLSEKRAADRIKAYERLNDNLRSTFLLDLIINENHLETLKLYIHQSLKKGELGEIQLACQCLGLLILTIGSQIDSTLIYNEFSSVLKESMKNSGKSNFIRQACSSALSFLCFIGGENGKETMELMGLFHEQMKSYLNGNGNGVEDYLVALIDGWGLLGSSIDEETLVREMGKEVSLLGGLLKHENVDVRTSAGENIAMMAAAEQRLKAAQKDEEEEEDSGAESGADDLEVDREEKKVSLGPSPLDGLIEKLQELSTDSNRHRAKKDRAVQRATFRDVLKAVEDGEEISETLTLNKKKFDFYGFSKVKQLNAIRDFCGAGFAVHFAHNPVVADIFEMNEDETAEADKTKLESEKEKAAAKAASRARGKESYLTNTKQRRKKAAMVAQQFD